MKVIFKSDFLKTLITHNKSTHGKWQINLSPRKNRFNFENWPTGTFILSVWKFLVEAAFKNGAFWASEPWIKIRQSNIVETLALVQLFTIVVNFKSATCFTSHTFALQTKWILMACTDHQVVDVRELFSELTESPIALQCVYDQA